MCKKLFDKKNQDYGTSWRIMRLPSVTDQIYIKAKRIRTIQIKATQKVADDIPSEFIGIINYGFIALMQIDLKANEELKLDADYVRELYKARVEKNRALMERKNHDYGEAWRDMRVPGMTDQILMKLERIKNIEDNDGKTLVSEGVESIYQDIINYSIFCLIKLGIHQHEDNK
ncbi:MAG: DUF1599 domain-containing protein [Bacteroidota bacterium]